MLPLLLPCLQTPFLLVPEQNTVLVFLLTLRLLLVSLLVCLPFLARPALGPYSLIQGLLPLVSPHPHPHQLPAPQAEWSRPLQPTLHRISPLRSQGHLKFILPKSGSCAPPRSGPPGAMDMGLGERPSPQQGTRRGSISVTPLPPPPSSCPAATSY